MAMCGIKLRTILQGLQNEKMIPILNESGLLKNPGFQDESKAITCYKNKWNAHMFVFQSLWN